jgi:hypothetical protein
VLGIAGGNGLDLINPRGTDAVYRYDINPDYLVSARPDTAVSSGTACI